MFTGYDASMIGEFSQESDQCTTHNIDGQRAEGKLDTLAEILSIAAQQVTKNRPNEPACTDEQECTQSVTGST